jgi:hypothetical protein
MDHYFNELSLKFNIKEGKFWAPSPEGIVIKSEGLQLKGGGSMDFKGKLDLGLMPELLHLSIPVVDQVFALLKMGLAQVWMTGDLKHPEVSFVTAGGLIPIPIDSTLKRPDRPLPRELRALPPDGEARPRNKDGE